MLDFRGLATQDLPLLRACVATNHDFERMLRIWEESQAIDTLPSQHLRLVPFLFRRAERLGVPLRDNAILRGIYLKFWYEHHTTHQKAFEALLATGLSERSLLLKGLALQALCYSADPATRPCEDVDILVRRRSRIAEYRALRTAGFWMKNGSHVAAQRFLRRAINLENSPSAIDLHWGLYDYSPDPDLETRLFARAEVVVIRESRFLALSPTDHLLHALLHGSGKNPVSPIRWIVDSFLLIGTQRVDWKIFVDEVARNRWRAPILQQLVTLVKVVGVEVPDFVVTAVEALPGDPTAMALYWRGQSRSRWLRALTKLAYRDQLLLAQTQGWRWSPWMSVALFPVVAGLVLWDSVESLVVRLRK